MRYLVLAADYDGTLASDGCVAESTLAALYRLRATGRRLILVTGRELGDLQSVFAPIQVFDRIVAENGAVLYRPAEKEEKLLSETPPPALLEALRRRGVPFHAGEAVVSTSEPYRHAVLDAIAELGLEMQVAFNKGSVMVLPTNINKASGLRCALNELGISEHNVVGVGDAENDHALLKGCEFGVAVANALPVLKERADWTTTEPNGDGVQELIRELIENDLARYDSHLQRHSMLIGYAHAQTSGGNGSGGAGTPVGINSNRGSLLIAGPSGSGKSTVASGVIERLCEQEYQFCLIDPEGDYESLPGAIVLGTQGAPPHAAEVMKLLEKPSQSVVVNLLGMLLSDRPLFFAALLPQLLELRARTARPHWIIVDEAHHLLPSAWVPAPAMVPQELTGLILITVHPDSVARAVLMSLTTAVVVGKGARQTLASFAQEVNVSPPSLDQDDQEPGTAVVWRRTEPGAPVIAIKVEPTRLERHRHIRKYVKG